MKIELKSTKNYDMFEGHELNRPLHEDDHLRASMEKHGFMPSSPIQCVRNGGSKLKVIRGHHRLYYAKTLGLPVWYVLDESNKDIFDLEASSKATWSVVDFAEARAQDGDEACIKLLNFRKKHGLTIGSASSLVSGQSASSGNMQKRVKNGTFKIGDMKHAEQVVAITDHCKTIGIPFATTSAFVAAISSILRVPEFDTARFMHCATLYPAMMNRRSSKDGCLDEIDALYNYALKAKRIPLAFRAKEVGRERQIASNQK
jgi:hypothetical protein